MAQTYRSLGGLVVPLRRWSVASLLLLLLCSCTPTIDVYVSTPDASAPASNEATTEPLDEATVPGAATVEAALSAFVTYLVLFAELCGALVIGVGVIRGVLRYVPHIAQRQPAGETYSEDIRLQLGKSLALALEFALAADILKTAVAPTLTVIAQLAAIAALRTFLNYFLDRELREVEQRRARQGQAQTLQRGSAPEIPGDPERPAAP